MMPISAKIFAIMLLAEIIIIGTYAEEQQVLSVIENCQDSSARQYADEHDDTNTAPSHFELMKRVPHPTWRQQGRIRHFAATIPGVFDAYEGISAGGNGRLSGYFDYASRPLFMRYRKNVHVLPYNLLRTLLEEG